MRRFATTALVMALTCGTAAAGGIGLFGSYWENHDDDEAAGAGVRMTLGGALAFDIAFTYFDEVNPPAIGAELPPATTVADLQVLPIDVGARYTFTTGTLFRPYVGAGLSYFMLDLEGARIDDEVGYYLLGGVLVGREEGLNLMVDLLWREAEGTIKVDTADHLVTDSTDVDFGGFGANLGIMFTW